MRTPLVYAVRVTTNNIMTGRDGRDRRNTAKRYFETREDAIKFCGDERRVLHVPQDKVFRFVLD